jgi:hypothetical protein
VVDDGGGLDATDTSDLSGGFLEEDRLDPEADASCNAVHFCLTLFARDPTCNHDCKQLKTVGSIQINILYRAFVNP